MSFLVQIPDKFSSVAKFEDYKSECKKYNLVPIKLITEAIMGGNNLNLKVCCVVILNWILKQT